MCYKDLAAVILQKKCFFPSMNTRLLIIFSIAGYLVTDKET